LRRFDPESDPHRRYNPLIGQYVLVSPHRTKRPWQGQTENTPDQRRPAYDPTCYLCPGNHRAGVDINPPYARTFVFDNDFSALLPDSPDVSNATHASGPIDQRLFQTEPVHGTCRVICFSPRHDLTLAEMEPTDIAAVIDTWAAETAALGTTHRWVQVFENKGAVMGCSNPHPHGQVWASSALPNEPAAEERQQRAYWEEHGSSLLLDYAARENDLAARTVHTSEHFIAVVPFWAVWPFETLIVARHPIARLPDLTPAARTDLAGFLRSLLGAYDRLFGVSFPYSMGWHGAPFNIGAGAVGAGAVDAGSNSTQHWQLHAHIFPPLLRSATVKKFMVGYELLGEPQRDLTAEQAARRLRDLVNQG
jgi:UDPglucose--hexose-1-phosphate uridylyltransferase